LGEQAVGEAKASRGRGAGLEAGGGALQAGPRQARRRRGGAGGGRAPVDAFAKGVYIQALSRGASHEAAARAAGFSRQAFAGLRKRDPEYAATVDEAIRRSEGPRFVSGGAKRRLQLRRNRRVLFTEERQEIFLRHFAGTANLADAAAAAGVSESTVWDNRERNPEFARRFQQALDQAYLLLDAHLLARRLEAQQRLRAIEPCGEPEPEFDRAMKLLQRWDRRNGRPGRRAGRRDSDSRWDFAEAIALLEKKLRNMGIPIEPLPPGYERPDGDLPLLPGPPPDGKEWDDGEGEGER
jgi:hypothetical protein